MKTKLFFSLYGLCCPLRAVPRVNPKRICQVHLRLKNRKNLSNLPGIKKCLLSIFRFFFKFGGKFFISLFSS